MNSMKNSDADQIMKCLEGQRDGYILLLEIMEKQKIAVLKEDEGKLLYVIQEKERVLGSLHGIGRKIELEVKALDKKQHDGMIKCSQSIRQEIEFLLSQILRLETFCENFLESKKSSLRNQMKTTKQGRSVLRGYGSSSLQRSRFSKNV
tara:strand:+ start:124 stop:570 length:447 start_codon:yes stop_codon:yes gene_type:complete